MIRVAFNMHSTKAKLTLCKCVSVRVCVLIRDHLNYLGFQKSICVSLLLYIIFLVTKRGWENFNGSSDKSSLSRRVELRTQKCFQSVLSVSNLRIFFFFLQTTEYYMITNENFPSYRMINTKCVYENNLNKMWSWGKSIACIDD